ncbi:SMI1/KNR4 family protein [Bacillus sp. XF8]|uniref:SMI1/KNR4 family protein n=1 Tax=Bacillus sp. XF8 TaxID=2819289 RepID=UPI001AA0715D|nr:SMI1/KNR4 family protein [Bacillus sp. XF8]MBO1580102.1 SMI1/KNR4 family protein [Bacillus sp. XF8]
MKKRKQKEFKYIRSYEKSASGVYPLAVSFYNPIQPEIEGIIPFARDPFGNLICFDYLADKLSPTIVFWDHEEQGEAAIEIICHTFSELLDGVHDD